VRCLSIAQCKPIQEQESRYVPQVRPCGRTTLKSELKWSATWWRWATFFHRRLIDHWVLAGGIDRFSIATPDHVYSSSFIVRISLRANPKDRVAVEGVLIDGRAGLLIRFVIAGCLTAAWNVIAEFLRPQGNSKLIVVMCRSSCSWVWCSRLLSSPTVNGSVSKRNRMPIRNFSS
jgi:hypothetical protein